MIIQKPTEKSIVTAPYFSSCKIIESQHAFEFSQKKKHAFELNKTHILSAYTNRALLFSMCNSVFIFQHPLPIDSFF